MLRQRGYFLTRLNKIHLHQIHAIPAFYDPDLAWMLGLQCRGGGRWKRVFLRNACKHLGSQVITLIACGVRGTALLAIYVECFFNSQRVRVRPAAVTASSSAVFSAFRVLPLRVSSDVEGRLRFLASEMGIGIPCWMTRSRSPLSSEGAKAWKLTGLEGGWVQKYKGNTSSSGWMNKKTLCPIINSSSTRMLSIIC